MPLPIRSKLRDELISATADALPDIEVRNEIFIVPDSARGLQAADSSLPQSGQLRETIENILGETPFARFATALITQELRDRSHYTESDTPKPLTAIAGYENSSIAAERIVSAFESLPWDYKLSIEMPRALGSQILAQMASLDISETIRIFRPDATTATTFPLTTGDTKRDLSVTGNTLLGMAFPPTWQEAGAYVQIDASGFVGPFGDTPTIQTAVDTLKAVCGIGIALFAFEVNPTYRPWPTKAKFFAHRRCASHWVLERAYELDSDISATFHDLVPSTIPILAAGDESYVRPFMMKNLADASFVLSHAAKAARIVSASQWLFDSYSSQRDLLSFVQAAICIEILLGDKKTSDVIGLGELLRNRLSYLIGVSHSQRDQLMSDFNKIYTLRSGIVHSGQSKFGSDERQLLGRLRWMCQRVIQEEVKLLQADLKPE